MNPQDKQNPLVTLYFQTLVRDLLGNCHYVSVSPDTAKMLWHACKNEHTVHIQFPSDEANVDILGRPITSPLLWAIDAWRSSSERHLRAKLRAKREKEALDVFRANQKMVAKAIVRYIDVHYDAAIVMAHSLLRNNEHTKIQQIGVKKLYTSVKEIP